MTEPANPLSAARRWAALAVLSASLVIITMDMTILTIALPEMAAELTPTSDQQLWIVDVYSLVLAGLLVSVAAIADRWGRKRMLVLGYVIFALASLLVLFANSAEAVIAIRALLGIGGAMIMPTTLSMIRVIFHDPKERTTALSIWAAVSGIGMVIGPLVGGALLEHFSWHAAFVVNVPLMILAAAAATFLLVESRVDDPGRWDVRPAALSLIGLVALVWSLKQFGTHTRLDLPAAWAAPVIAIAALGWFTRHSLRPGHRFTRRGDAHRSGGWNPRARPRRRSRLHRQPPHDRVDRRRHHDRGRSRGVLPGAEGNAPRRCTDEVTGGRGGIRTRDLHRVMVAL